MAAVGRGGGPYTRGPSFALGAAVPSWLRLSREYALVWHEQRTVQP